LNQGLLLLFVLAFKGATIALPILDSEIVFIKKVVLIIHDIASSVFEGNSHEKGLLIVGSPRNDEFCAQQIHSAFNNVILLSKDCDRLF
jgi:hypothetical protein